MTRSKPAEPPKHVPWVKMHRSLVAIMVAIVGFLSVVYWLSMQAQRTVPNPEVPAGQTKVLEHLRLSPLTGDGKPVSLEDLKGHVVLLNFWGTWCLPCRTELPHIAELQKRYAGHEAFRLLAVSCPSAEETDDVQSLRENTSALLRRLNLDLPTYRDPESATQIAVGRLLGAEGFAYPTTLLLDRRGAVRAVWTGYRPGVETEMERWIGTLLEGKE